MEAGEVVPMTDKKELDGRNYLKMISASGHLSLILETPGSIGAGLSMINGDFYLLREAELKKGCKKVKTEIFRNFQSYQLYIPFLIC